jgi:hypothetical protein
LLLGQQSLNIERPRGRRDAGDVVVIFHSVSAVYP